jgi:hypothetical protein
MCDFPLISVSIHFVSSNILVLVGAKRKRIETNENEKGVVTHIILHVTNRDTEFLIIIFK